MKSLNKKIGDPSNKLRAPKEVLKARNEKANNKKVTALKVEYNAQGGIWNEQTKSYTFEEGQHIEIDGSYINVSGMEVQINKDCEYGSTAINLLLTEIKPQAEGIEIIPSYLKQNFEEEGFNQKNAKLIQSEIQKIINARKKEIIDARENNPTEVISDETTILIPYNHTAFSAGEPSNHWSLLALKFSNNFTECEPYSITTSGDNSISAENVNEGIKKVIPSGIKVDETIDIVTMQQNSLTAGSIPTLDCGPYLIQNAENIAALGLVGATFQIDKTQNEAKQPIERQNVNLRGISLRARHASIIALKVKEYEKSSVVKMFGGKSFADSLKDELQKKIESKREKEAAVGKQSSEQGDATTESQIDVSGGSSSDFKEPEYVEVVQVSNPITSPTNSVLSVEDAKLVVEKQIPAQNQTEILQDKLSEVTSSDKAIFFHLGKFGNSTEELKVKTDKAEIVVKREENARARPIITPQIISLNQSKSQHRAEFGGVVFDESSVKKDADGKNEENGIFNNADLQSANFRGCKFNKIDFSAIDPKVLATISFTNCEFEDCNFPKDFKFQQYQFKFKKTENFDINTLTSERGDKRIPKGIPADKFEAEPFPAPASAFADTLKSAVMARQ